MVISRLNQEWLPVIINIIRTGSHSYLSADGFRLAVVTLDCDGEGQVLINRDELAGVANALRKARRVNLSFEASGERLDGTKLIIDTEAIRYSFTSADGTFPDYETVTTPTLLASLRLTEFRTGH